MRLILFVFFVSVVSVSVFSFYMLWNEPNCSDLYSVDDCEYYLCRYDRVGGADWKLLSLKQYELCLDGKDSDNF